MCITKAEDLDSVYATRRRTQAAYVGERYF